MREWHILVAQGIVGSTPWNAMVFFTLWLQLLGFTDYSASVLMALFAGGCAIGSALGGYLGDPKGILCMSACNTSIHVRQVH